jgi:hypothetical protein
MLNDPIGVLKEMMGFLGQHPLALILIVLAAAFSLLQFGDPGNSADKE